MIHNKLLTEQHRLMSYLIDEYLVHIRAGGATDATVARKRASLTQLHGYLPAGIGWARTSDIEMWATNPDWSPATRHAYIGDAKGFFTWLTEEAHLDGNPAARLVVPSVPASVARPVDDDELAIALSAPEPVRTAIILATWEGMRRAEVSRCDREHITPTVVRIKRGKGGKPRVVPTHRVVWDHVRDLPPGPVVIDSHGRRLSPASLGGRVNRWLDRAGLPEVTIHRFRHWFGTTVQEQQGDIRVTQELLGHASITSTQIYTRVTDERRAAAIAALPVVRPEPADDRLGPTAPLGS